MTLDQLHTWRRIVPFTISGACIVPFVVSQNSLNDAQQINELIVPLVAMVAAFLYIGLRIRDWIWDVERAKLRPQIRDALFDFLPDDLNVTPDDWLVLQNEVFKSLTGVFWEAVDRDPQLVTHKEHFYANGIIYTTAIDVYLICGFSAICYVIAYFALAPRQGILLVWAAVLLGLALVSRLFVLPRLRTAHLKLSAEQLDLLRRNQREFVETRFREIVLARRRERL